MKKSIGSCYCKKKIPSKENTMLLPHKPSGVKMEHLTIPADLDRFYRKETISFSKKFTRSCIYLGYSFHVFLQCR